VTVIGCQLAADVADGKQTHKSEQEIKGICSTCQTAVPEMEEKVYPGIETNTTEDCHGITKQGHDLPCKLIRYNRLMWVQAFIFALNEIQYYLHRQLDQTK